MEKEIAIKIRDRIATTVSGEYVCGNSDYVAVFGFDEDWDEFNTKTARFDFGDESQDVVFTGNICQIPIISNVHGFHVGVFAGNLRTSTGAYVPACKSILCKKGIPAAPSEDVYAQIMEKLNAVANVSKKEIKKAVESYLCTNDGYVCTNGAYVGGDTWSMAEPAAVMDVPYLKEYGYKCAAEDGTQELYTWIYRCLYEGFSVPYRTVSVNGVETVFETEAAKDDAVIVDHIEANYGQYAATILKMLESEDIGLLRIPLVQFPELTQQSVRHAFERVTQDSPEMCFPFFPLSAANEVFMPVIASEDGYSFLYSFFPTAQKREEINATIAAAVEAVKAKVYEVHGVKAGDALTEDQKRKVAKTIHDWIIINSNYNGEIVTYWQPTMYGVFNPAISASCEGYTQAFNYLVRLYGIEAVTLTGIAYYGWDGESYNISGGHAWNAVNLTDEYGAYSADASKWAALDVYWDVPSHEVKVSGELPEGNVIWKYFMNPANVLAAYGSESYREITTDGSYGAYPFGNAPSADYSYNGNSEYIWED